jgi:hypothetical protein
MAISDIAAFVLVYGTRYFDLWRVIINVIPIIGYNYIDRFSYRNRYT